MPNEFIPERWTTRAELVKNHSVFLPFSAGKSFRSASSDFSISRG